MLSKEKQTHSQEKRHAEELKRFQNNVNKRFSNNEADDANQIGTEDLKIRQIQASF